MSEPSIVLPCRVVEHSWEEASIYDAGDVLICSLRVDESLIADDDMADAATAEMADRARRIVQAVNAHDALVAALSLCERSIVLIGNACNDKHVSEAVMERALAAQLECIDAARTALAAAGRPEGEKA